MGRNFTLDDRAKIYTLTTRGNYQLVQMTTQLQNTWRAPSFLSITSFPKLDLFNLEQREGVGFHLGIGYQALTPRHLESWTWLGVYADLHSCLRTLNIGKAVRALSEHICMHNIL